LAQTLQAISRAAMFRHDTAENDAFDVVEHGGIAASQRPVPAPKA
jgi:hypothetical protein